MRLAIINPLSAIAIFISIGHVLAAPNENSWEFKHMKNEHHLTMYDDDAFFRIHDLDRTGFWTPDDVTSLYGVKDNKEQDAFHETDIPPERVNTIRMEIMRLIDADLDGKISRDEWISFKKNGGELPDFGFEGHHEDEETEFDLHHVEVFHSDPNDDDESKWNHPEDIEHFRKHDEKYHAVANADPLKNIPARYRKSL